jgi:hypothetical protein
MACALARHPVRHGQARYCARPAANIATTAYLYGADRVLGQNLSEALILVTQRGDMPFTQPLDLQGMIVK